MGWLCWLFGALVFITLLGHGIWVAIAKIFGPRKSTPRPNAVLRPDYSAMETELTHLLDSGLIDLPTYSRVLAAIKIKRHPEHPPPAIPVASLAPHEPSVQSPPPIHIGRIEDPEQLLAESPEPPGPIPAPPPIALAPDIEPVASPSPPRIAPPIPRPPRRPFSQVFAAFLHDSNIRWGELVGGLLIIGCSVALVISFWSQIAAKPFFQFGLFTSVTAATLALGLYAEHRWKLPTTSRGILLIATMLVPLNFLALAALSHGVRPSPFVMAGEEAALALFGFLVWQAARVLAPYWPFVLTQGVVLLSGSLLVIQYLNPRASHFTLLGLAAIPVGFYEGTMILMLRHASAWKKIRPHGAEAIFLVLGVLTFATLLPLGLLIFPAPDPSRAAHELSELLTLAAAPSLATGLLLWKRISSRRAAKYRAAGTAIAISAAFLMLACLALAWPDPRTLLPLAAINLIVFSFIAWRLEFPLAHAPAMPCLAIVYWLAVELLRGRIGWNSSTAQLTAVLSAAFTGPTFLPLFALLAAGASLLATIGRARLLPSRISRASLGSAGASPSQIPGRTEARIYAWTAAAIAAINIIQTARNGFGVPTDPHAATWIFLVYASAALLAARSLRLQAAGWIGCVLLAASFVQFFLTRTSLALPWPTALLCYATIALVGTILRRRDAAEAAPLLVPARWTAIIAIAISAALLSTALSFADLTPIAIRLAWVSALCFAISAVEAGEIAFVLAQLSAAVSAALIVLARLALRPWFGASIDPLLEPWTLQAIACSLAAVALLIAIVRRLLPERFPVAAWLARQYAFDRVLSLLLAAAFAAMAVGAITPGVAWELPPIPAGHYSTIWSNHAAGLGSWLLLALLLLTFAIQLRGSWVRMAYPVLLTLTAFACLLWAARWSDQHAAASAARWALALLLPVGSLPVWLRRRLPKDFDPVACESRLLLAVFFALPVLAVSLYVTVQTLGGAFPAGPDPHCIFGLIGKAASYLIPLIVIAAVFVLNALREQSQGWAFSASAVCNLAVTLAYALAISGRREADTDDAIRLVQLNAVALALFALAWLLVRRGPIPSLLRMQLVLAIAGNVVLLAPAAGCIIFWPGWANHLLGTVGEPAGWIALAATFAAMIRAIGARGEPLNPAAFTMGVFAAGVLVACALAGRFVPNWADYHALMLAAVAASGVNLGAGAWIGRSRRGWAEPAHVPEPAPVPAAPQPVAPVELQYARHDESGGPQASAIYVGGQLLQPAVLRWTAIASTLAVLLSIRAMAGDPGQPWWSAGITATTALLWAALACWLAVPRMLYAGGLLLNLAATFWFLSRKAWASPTPLLDLSLVNLAVLAISGLAALVLHLHVFGGRMQPPTRDTRLPFHRFAAVVSMMGLIAIVGMVIAGDATREVLSPSLLMTWAAIGPSLVLAIALLWDPDAPYVVAEMYVFGLIAMAAGLHEADYFHQPIAAVGGVAISSYLLLTGFLFASRQTLAQWISTLGMPKLRQDETVGWLAPAGLVLLAASIALAFDGDFHFAQLPMRLVPATATILGILGLVLISRGDRRLDLRYAIFTLLPVAATAWAWAWLPPGSADLLLRAVVLVAVLGFSLIVFGAIALRDAQASLWPVAARRGLQPLALCWAGAVLVVFGIELTTAYSGKAVSLAGWGTAIVLINLIAGAAACVLFALARSLNPLKLPKERRGLYVYLAETMLGLGLAHLRLTMPWLFGGALSQYWPLLVMALAFGGVALAEVFRRRGTIELSSPLFRTGAFLPLLPLIAFWAAPSHVQLSTLLFTIGIFYAVLSAARRSFGFGVLAAVAANGGLWSLLARQPAVAFYVHPQVWLIPAAVSVLIAAQLNRDRIAPGQLRFVRYCCLIAVYVSSTADIFLNGVQNHPWLPLVLAGLSVLGVLLGILFRLRAFLFLGTSFLALSVLTMIYYASADLHWTWLWYVAGIALGASILVLFALFEKKRAEMLAIVDGLKTWE